MGKSTIYGDFPQLCLITRGYPNFRRTNHDKYPLSRHHLLLQSVISMRKNQIFVVTVNPKIVKSQFWWKHIAFIPIILNPFPTFSRFSWQSPNFYGESSPANSFSGLPWELRRLGWPCGAELAGTAGRVPGGCKPCAAADGGCGTCWFFVGFFIDFFVFEGLIWGIEVWWRCR